VLRYSSTVVFIILAMSCVGRVAQSKFADTAWGVPSGAADAANASVPTLARVDLHMHLTMAQALPFYSGELGKGDLTENPNNNWMNQIEFSGLKKAGVKIIVAAIWVPLPTRVESNSMKEAHRQIDRFGQFITRHPELVWVTDASQVASVMAQQKIAVLASLEGAEMIREPADVDALYARGIRAISLTHFEGNHLASAEPNQMGPLSPLFLKTTNGVTELGLRVLTRMRQLGIIVDLAHAADDTIDAVLAEHERLKLPLIYSHEGAVMERAHSLTEMQMQRIGALEGFIGIGVFRHPLLKVLPAEERFSGFAPGTCDEVVAHAMHLMKHAGASAVALGTDFGSPILRAGPGGLCPQGIRNTSDLPVVLDAIQQRLSPSEVAAFEHTAERFLHLWSRVEPVH
jgi:membrane dipeptidase